MPQSRGQRSTAPPCPWRSSELTSPPCVWSGPNSVSKRKQTLSYKQLNSINFCNSYRHAAAAAKSLLSCLTLCNPTDGSPPGSPIPGILQARTLEWVAISFSNAWKWKVKVKLLSHVQLLATPWTAAYQAPPSMGFSRQEYWSGVPLPSPHTDMRGMQNQMTMRDDQDGWFIASLRELLCSQPPDSSAFSWRAASLHVGEGKKLIPVMPRRMNHSYHRGGKPNKRGQSHPNFTLEATSMVSAPCRREWGVPNSLEEKESWEAGTPASRGASSPLGVWWWVVCESGWGLAQAQFSVSSELLWEHTWEDAAGDLELEIQGLYLTQGDRSLCDRKLEWVISAVLEPNPGESDHQHHLGNLNKIGRYSPHPRNTRSEILAQSPGLCALSNFPGNSDDKPAQGKHAMWNPTGILILEIHSSEMYWHRKHSSKSIWKIWQSHGNMDKAVLF